MPQSHKTVGDGLVTKAGTWDELLAWAKEGALAREPVLVLFDSSGGDGEAGERFDLLADDARRWGLPTIGAGKFARRLEKDRSYGFEVAQAMGAVLPPYHEFASFTDALTHVKDIGDTATFFKSDRYLEGDATHGANDGESMARYLEELIADFGGRGSCIIQEKIGGVPISTARWWNGSSFVGRYEVTYENKKLMSGDFGPSTGCALNALWFAQEEPLTASEMGFENAAIEFRRSNAGAGIYDMNAILTPNGDVRFLEWTPRFGYDSEPTSQSLIPDLGAHLYAVATGKEPPEVSDDAAFSVRLSVPPYPWEHGKKGDKGGCDGQWVDVNAESDPRFIPYNVSRNSDGRLVVASGEGLVGLALAVGSDIASMGEDALDCARDLAHGTAGLQARDDAADDVAEQMAEAQRSGLDVHPMLLA